MLKIEEGKYYRTRDGRKVGPAHSADRNYEGQAAFEVDGPHASIHRADGTYAGPNCPELDLIAEWTDGPVVTETVTKTRIVPGTYDGVQVGFGMAPRTAYVYIYEQRLTADELDAAAAVLSALAKGLRDA